MKILVVYGGYGLSPEADVSKRSGEAVLEWFKTTSHEVEGFLLREDNVLVLVGKVKEVDLVLPILHGHFGESGHIQKILEDADVPFFGSDSKSSELCWDKYRYKEFLQEHDILVPQGGRIVSFGELSHIAKPFVLKSSKGGSSIGVWVIRDEGDLNHLNQEEIMSFGDLFWEEYVTGNEITVGVFKGEVLPVIEVIPPDEAWFDYENKYNGKTTEAIPPINVELEIQKEAQELALKIHELCGCKDLSRTDMFVKQGRVYVLETNTMPGMTDESLFPKMILASGRSLEEFAREMADIQDAHGV